MTIYHINVISKNNVKKNQCSRFKGLRLINLENIFHPPLMKHYNMIQYLIKLHVNHNSELVILKYDLLLYHNTSSHLIQNEVPTFPLV